MLEFNATFLIAMISFVVFIIIMNAIFYKPILGIIEKRQKFIDDNYKIAQNSKLQSEKLLNEREQKLNNIAKEARVLIANETQLVKKNAEQTINTAKLDAKTQIESAKSDLFKEKESMDLATNAQELAQLISKKLLGENTWIH